MTTFRNLNPIQVIHDLARWGYISAGKMDQMASLSNQKPLV
ncbi:hypothetical protein PBAL39_23787 [Pedobacter sp. BAL39]|nr:hypothetical protein PBAL39_23787 [Pedobacter sp. BAL39]